jgi:hypothetical protein
MECVVSIELSVVTGTFNRLPYLKKMVQSVRDNMGVGIPYEIVLVDGGSEDGTIEWCKEQHDIVLIEQGELLGAIKAFNEGLFAARGRYCVVGNDDIIYLDDTLIKAISYMEDNPTIGVGCFYQDRDHPGKFNLSYMPAIVDGEQMNHLYGQVCIVPRWLGNEVGWWGSVPGLRTYGGDNNLSSFILEKGYRVTGVPCACISDMQVQDELREINNAYRMKGMKRRGHPDSNLWGNHWTHQDGTCGPIVRHDPYRANPLKRKKRFLYLPIYEQGHAVQKTQKRGLRDALARYGMVYEFDWLQVVADHGGGYMINYLMDIMDAWQPDLLLTQIHTPDSRMFNKSSINRIRGEFPKVAWVNWNGDYHPEDLLTRANIDMASLFDIQCVVTTRVGEHYTRGGVGWMYWQIGYEESDAEPNKDTPRHDVVFLANGYSNDRLRLGRMLQGMKGVDVGIYGSWGAGVRPSGSNLYNFDAGQMLYRAAKISVGDNQWGDRATGFTSNRMFQAMAAGGALFMQQYIPGLEELLGLKDGVHYIAWKDNQDLVGKIYHYMDGRREKMRARIAQQGMEFVRQHHSFDARVQELMEVL